MRKKRYSQKKSSNKLLIPIILMIGFIPLIVHTYTYNSGLSQFDWFPDASETLMDVFFGWKMIAIIIVGAVMLGILLFHVYKEKTFQFENAFYLLFSYALFVAISALFSPYKYWVTHGTYDLFESVWVVFAYIILCYYTYNYVREEKQVETILRWSGIGVFIVALIGVFQSFGLDFFKSAVGIRLITDPSIWGNLDKVNFAMAENTSYATLYNPNYLSFYFGMLLPIAVCLLIASKKFLLPYRIALVIIIVLSILCIEGSHSDSGWAALVIGIGIVTLILLSRTKKTLFIGIGAAIIGFVILFAVCVLTPLGTKISDTIVGTYHMEERFALRGIETTTDSVILDIRGNKVFLTYETSDIDDKRILTYTDDNGASLASTRLNEENLIDRLDDPVYAECQIQQTLVNDMPGIRVDIEDKTWDFVYIADDGYYYLNPFNDLVQIKTIDGISVFRENAMSGRGHIWNNTIPLLGKHIFAGIGANAYMLVYPQDDYIYRIYASSESSFNVKAHCWYLQQWMENGLIGLLLLIGFLGWYLVRSTRIYRRANLKETITWVGIGFFAAVLVYMIVALANDSNVATAPVFWGVLGLGMAVNRIVAEKEGLFVVSVKAEELVEEEASLEHKVTDEALNQKKSGKKKSRKKRKNAK